MKTIISTLICLITLPTILYANDLLEECEAELFTAREPAKFELAVETATKLGMHKQVILEATFLYYVDTENYKAIAAIHTQFQNQLEEFDLDTSKIFATKEQWQSVIQYSLALQALEKSDSANFKKHITEAYWLSPETASAFSHHITVHRNKKIMEKITIAPDREMITLENGKPITFEKLIQDKDALILRFWSPWNQQLDTTYPLIESAATQCQGKNIAFASILLDNDEQLITHAKELITEAKPALPGQWLIDSNNSSLNKQLRVSDLPTLVIITKEGKISYHGSASNSTFWENLTKLNAEIKKPNNNNQE
ncbi:MAG: thioredoxin-like domain-containing protein [Akkermansiaceae bacterium]